MMKQDPAPARQATDQQQPYAIDVRTYQEGAWILREGDDNQWFYVILSGTVRLIQKDRVVRVLGEQDVFGLESLFLRTSSPVGARALDSCRISAYGFEAMDFFLERQPRMMRSFVTSLLRQLGRTSTQLATGEEDFSLDQVDVRFYAAGETVIREDTVGTEFYRLVSSENGLVVRKRQQEIGRIVRPGEIFGEMAGLLRTPRHATVISKGESVVQVFDADALDLIIRDYPELVTQLIQSLAARLASVSDRLTRPGPLD